MLLVRQSQASRHWRPQISIRWPQQFDRQADLTAGQAPVHAPAGGCGQATAGLQIDDALEKMNRMTEKAFKCVATRQTTFQLTVL